MHKVFNIDWFGPTLCSYLNDTDALSLSTTTPTLKHVQLLHNVEHSETWEEGRRFPGYHQQGNADKWQALNLQNFRCHTVFLDMIWNDQGWGNQKGMFFIVDNNGSGGIDKKDGITILPAHVPHDYQRNPPCVVASTSKPAPHHSTRLRLSFQPKSDTTYSLWIRAGGGGGHSLEIRNCHVHILENVF
mmetsp:Transcript_45804/g.58831  ORF Transcript_45804/g.58831 Transcript_45804/m.58831 type:complete len:188 (+) Transcript_45804:175-738(+)